MNASASLGATLKAAAFGKVTEAISGKVLIEAGGGAGVVARYEIPAGGATPQDVAATLSRLLDRYDVAVAALGLGTTSITPTTDAQILAYMLGQMLLIRSYGTDHSVPNFRP